MTSRAIIGLRILRCSLPCQTTWRFTYSNITRQPWRLAGWRHQTPQSWCCGM